MKDNIKNNSATLDMLKALNPNIKKDFNGDNTKSYSCSVVKEETEREREHRMHFSISSIAKRLARGRGLNLFKSKTIELAVAGGNSSGAVITSNHVITIEFSDLNSWLDFNKMLIKTKFLKEVKAIEDGKLLYKFNIKVYDKHELNLDKSLSNFSDIFIGYYYNICKEKDIDFIDVNAVSDLATRLFDDDWCALDSIMH